MPGSYDTISYDPLDYSYGDTPEKPAVTNTAAPVVANTTTNTASQPIDIGFGPGVYTTPDTLGKSVSSDIVNSNIGIGTPTTNWQDALKSVTNFMQQNKGVLSAGALASALSGGGSGGGNGGVPVGIPSLVANRMQVPGTNDPYRVPGSSGRQYFTDTVYSDPSQVANAQALIQAQAQAIAANQPNAPVPSFAMPWNKQPGGKVLNQATTTPQDLTSQLQNAWSAGNVGSVNNLIGSNNLDLAALQKLFPQLDVGGIQALQNAGVKIPGGTNTSTQAPTTAIQKVDPVKVDTTKQATPTLADQLLSSWTSQKPADITNINKLITDNKLDVAGLQKLFPTLDAGGLQTLINAGVNVPGYTAPTANTATTTTAAPSTGIAALANSSSNAVTPTTTAAPVYYGQGVSGSDIVNFVNANMSDPATIASAMQQYGLSANDVAAATGYSPQQVNDYLATVNAATGGLMGYAHGGEAKQPRYLSGDTDGMADEINTTIDDRERAKLSHGEFVVPADVVSHLGNGNSDAGAKKLYDMMSRVRKARTGNPKQGKQIDAEKFTGGIAGYATGGKIQSFATGTQDGTVSSGSTSGIAGLTNTGGQSSQTLSSWAAPYVTSMLGQGQALANAPMQTYQGPLTAGQSALQNQQFSGLSEMAQTGYDPMNYQSQNFGAEQAQQYMNPYLSASLAPQLSELQRQAQINNANDASKLTGAGAYGGGRQAVLMGEQNRNLLDKSNQLIGAGYNTAYNNAMSQFNADQTRQAAAQQNTEASRQFSANQGLKTLDMLGAAGAAQRDIAQQGISADQAQFQQQQLYPYQQLAFQQSLLGGLPISTATTTPNAMSDTGAILAALGVTSNPDIAAKLKTLGLA